MDKKFFIIANNLQNEDATPVIHEVIITPEDIEDARENGESDEEVIAYIMEDEISVFEQSFFATLALREKDFEALKEKIKNM
jgi:hypothetical protein